LHQFASDGLDRGFKGFGVVPDVGGRHWRLSVAQLIAQHLARLVEDAFAPSHALEIAFSQSAPQDRVVIRHFSRDDAAPCGNVVGVRVFTPALNQFMGRL
jgi:hypothetical protein